MPMPKEGGLAMGHRPPCSDCPYCEISFYSLKDQGLDGFIMYSSDLSVEEANGIISGYLSTIREASDVLAGRMEMHADLFMSRWKKYSQAKREDLLRAIAPNIAPNPWHTFDYEGIPPAALEERVCDPKTRHQLLLPWLDIETLKTHPHTLFALLHYRIRHPPQAWAPFDIKQLNFGWQLGYFKVRFAHTGVMVHGLRYGELTDWDCPASRRADILGFPKAELLFEAQAYLMATLRDLVLQVLSGVDERISIRTSKWRELTATSNFRLTNEIELWSPHIFPAFSPPPTLDLHHITSLANARLSAIRDHLWQLQCNPTWMRRQIKLFLGKKANTDQERSFRLKHFLANLVAEVYSYMMWRWVEIECKTAKDLQQRFRDSIHPGQPLPRKYDKAIGELELLLLYVIEHTGDSLVQDTTIGDVSNYLTDLSQLDGKWNSKDPLTWCIVRMVASIGYLDDPFDNAIDIRYFQHHLSVSNFQEKSRVNEFVYKWVADLSAFSEILALVRLGRPKAQRVDLKGVMKTDHREEWLLVKKPFSRTCMDSFYDPARRLLQYFFTAEPPSGPKDLKWLQRSRATRAILEQFWSSLHELMSTALEKNQGISKDEVQRMLQVITRTQSAEYQQVVLVEEAKILTKIEQHKTAQETSGYIAKPLCEMMKTVVKKEPRKEKIKTRPQENKEADVVISKDVTESQMQTLEPCQTPALVRPTKRALNAIRFMFPTTPVEASGSLQWVDFVHVMGDMGFVAQHGGGSAVSFEADGQGKIVVHRPHPESKIEPVMLHTIGARMNKLFGWKRESFVLDEA
ncbi:hypothetical protein F4824DRAFT_516357 [Ustulina deusta]|nr:hypothetical protein F4824DRAFT_516357 [Ustulina deusta]